MENRINIPAGVASEAEAPQGGENAPKTREKTADKKKLPKTKIKGIQAKEVNRYLGYVVFMVFIGLVYIWSSHLAEKQVRREEQLVEDLDDMKAKYKTFNARLSSGTRKSEIAKKVEPLGLRIPEQPPFKIVVKSE